MRVCAWWHEDLDVGQIASHLTGKVAEDGRGSHDLESPLSALRLLGTAPDESRHHAYNENSSHVEVTVTSLDAQVERRLLDHQVRFTKGRRRLVAALAEEGGPRSAAELHDALAGEVPLSSLYRSLAVLEDAGIVEPHFSVKGVTRYELAEWLQGHHHHLICLDCGSVEDLALTAPQEEKVERLVADIGSVVSFIPVAHALEIEGRCERCA